MTKLLNKKFWFINGLACFIVLTFIGQTLLQQQIADRPFWQSTPFQLAFLLSVWYFFQEGKLIHQVIISQKIKEEELEEQFKVVNKADASTTKEMTKVLRR